MHKAEAKPRPEGDSLEPRETAGKSQRAVLETNQTAHGDLGPEEKGRDQPFQASEAAGPPAPPAPGLCPDTASFLARATMPRREGEKTQPCLGWWLPQAPAAPLLGPEWGPGQT